jgi:hypothetical protein
VRLGSSRPKGDVPFRLIPLKESDGWHLRVVASNFAGDVPLGMYPTDDPIFKTGVIAASGEAYLKLSITPSTGAILSREVKTGESMPESSAGAGEWYYLLGAYTFTPSDAGGTLTANNLAYGPVDAAICRDYFEVPARYSVSFKGATYIGL